ncbi:putative RING zinc finger domain superfamily protein isoform 2 [Zea mays]|uniref:Protein binding protein n=1 Tax=Zea mays TaxID=4577 RepID=B6U5U6_MAIZE|nr:putative RING zinc finger domain superfamily protein isoform 2 [Zea mays]ACG44729.1 protein binding protein [Zea mays]|eukprot:NP_001344829.1 putative RING zinc finger domain superfamily protein isoform 2 [Zea mays]
MPAQKLLISSPTPDDSDGRVAVRHAAATRQRVSELGSRDGASREMDGKSVRQERSSHREPRDGVSQIATTSRWVAAADETEPTPTSSRSYHPMRAGTMDEFMLVKLAEIRKEVQCPICLGIIRKTRTVMECLHRFCRDCIDKSMRLGNNECPACRTHCASRRSLRDDPNYDALIAALYPDIDKYEEEEFAFSEQERIRNKKIQETIEETFRRQSDAIGKKRSMAKATATAFARKYRRTRGRVRTIPPDIAPTGSSEEESGEGNSKETIREQSSADDHSPDLRQKRCRKRSGPQGSPAGTIGSIDYSFEENDELVGGKEILATSPLQGEMLAWGKNGARSQNRHGSVGSNGRTGRSGRIAKLVDYLHTADEMDKEFQLFLLLLPVDGQTIPNLEKPYLSCRPTLSIKHLAQFVALQLSCEVEELEMYIRMDRHRVSVGSRPSSTGEAKSRPFDDLERLNEEKLVSELHPSFVSSNGDMELRYALRTRE